MSQQGETTICLTVDQLRQIVELALERGFQVLNEEQIASSGLPLNLRNLECLNERRIPENMLYAMDKQTQELATLVGLDKPTGRFTFRIKSSQPRTPVPTRGCIKLYGPK